MFTIASLLPLLVGCENNTTLIKEKKVLAVSPSLVDIPTVTVGDTVTEEIDLTWVSGPQVSVVNVELLPIAGDWFTTEEIDLLVVAQGTTEKLVVTYNPQDEGYHRTRLTINTDEEDSPKHIVELRGSAFYPQLDLWPTRLDFGPVASGGSSVKSLVLRNSGQVRLDLVSVTVAGAGFSTTQGAESVNGGDELEIPITFAPDNTDPASGTATLDLGSADPRTVDLMGNDCVHGDTSLYDTDGDGYTSCAGDCDDTQGSAWPGATESCDSVDNDCDGTVDEQTSCFDDDGDGLTELDGDCNDGDPAVYPGAEEDLTNGIDDDCDGVTDLGSTDLDGDGYGDNAGDCDDTDPTVYPGAPELEDGIDNDCDRIVDEGTNAYDDDGDGLTENQGDCNDSDPAISSGARERADGLDNDCDGTVDEGTTSYDDDGDGFTEAGGDCDDTNPLINPAELEIIGDATDNDCDGVTQ
jgi:hypothetical protein